MVTVVAANLLSRLPRASQRQQRLMQKAIRGDFAARLWLKPWEGMANLDPWQTKLLVEVLPQERNAICCCSRQAGKTQVAALAAYIVGCLGEFAMIVGPSDRQSVEHMTVVQEHHAKLQNKWPMLGRMVADPTKHEITFANGGRILALPNSPAKIRGFRNVRLLIVEEAAF